MSASTETRCDTPSAARAIVLWQPPGEVPALARAVPGRVSALMRAPVLRPRRLRRDGDL